MPYIPRSERTPSRRTQPDTPGELNYAFTKLADEYVWRRGKTYDTLNTVVGAFESAKAEFQRRVVAPYEDQKCEENGDVYTQA